MEKKYIGICEMLTEEDSDDILGYYFEATPERLVYFHEIKEDLQDWLFDKYLFLEFKELYTLRDLHMINYGACQQSPRVQFIKEEAVNDVMKALRMKNFPHFGELNGINIIESSL